MKAFEIYTFRDGRWKMDSVFDDRDLAIFDAQRMDSSKRFSGVRVIEETFDEDTNETKTRTIFSRTKEDLANSKIKTLGNKKSGKTAQDGGTKSGHAGPKKRKRKKEQNKKKGFGVLTVILAFCVFGGVAALIALRILADAI